MGGPGASAPMATPVGVFAAVLGLVGAIPGVAGAVPKMGVSMEAVSGVAARPPGTGAAASGADREGA